MDQTEKARAFRVLVGRMTSIQARYALNQAITPDQEAYELVQILYGDDPVPSRRLPESAVQRDRDLEAGDLRSLEHHRWHWTLNPDNPERVSMGEYALTVDRHRQAVAVSAQAYQYELDGGPPRWHGRRR